MGDILELFNQDYSSIILGIFIIMAGIIAVVEIIGRFSVIIGKPVAWIKDKENDHELLIKTAEGLTILQEQHKESVKQSIRHDDLIKEDIKKLSDTVDSIVEKLDKMQRKIDHTEMSKLKEQILAYYKKYKDVGEWDRFESEVFWGLYDSYISHGGNSFVRDEIRPVMEQLNIKY